MPPKKKSKEGGSKKIEQKKKQKSIEDQTFGLKNKNKSKKVQQFVHSVTHSVMNSGDRRQRQMEEQRKKHRVELKARKKAAEDETNALFGEALMAINKKKSTNQKEGKAEAKGRDGNDDAAKKGTSRAMKMMYQMDAKEMEQKLKEDPNYVPTIEDKIEAERQEKVEELQKSGKGTKVTPETFGVWQERKRKKRADAARKLVEIELKKKKGGKGLAVLSGRDLYEYKKDLFNVDDEKKVEEKKVEAKDDIDGKVEDDVEVEQLTTNVKSDLFLQGDDEDLDDIEDD